MVKNQKAKAPQTHVALEDSDKNRMLQYMLQCRCHLGTKSCDHRMKRYVFKRTVEGVNLIHLGKTYEKIVIAARILAAVENPDDIAVISARPYGSRAVMKFAQFIGARAYPHKWVPGALTNQITKQFMQPTILVVTDPRMDSQAIKESTYVNVPVIALCDTDAPMDNIDCAIPVNNRGKESIALVYWMLAREILYIKGKIATEEDKNNWAETVRIDAFMWRDLEEIEKREAAREAEKRQAMLTGGLLLSDQGIVVDEVVA